MLVTALGSWGNTVPRGHKGYAACVGDVADGTDISKAGCWDFFMRFIPAEILKLKPDDPRASS